MQSYLDAFYNRSDAFIKATNERCRDYGTRFNNAVANFASKPLQESQFYKSAQPLVAKLPEAMRLNIQSSTVADVVKGTLMCILYFELLRTGPKGDLMPIVWNVGVGAGAYVISSAHDFNPHLWAHKEWRKSNPGKETIRAPHNVDYKKVMFDEAGKRSSTHEVEGPTETTTEGAKSPESAPLHLKDKINEEIIHDGLKGLQLFAFSRLALSVVSTITVFSHIEKAGLLMTLGHSALHASVAGFSFVVLKNIAEHNVERYGLKPAVETK
jgi:hypothetical protein